MTAIQPKTRNELTYYAVCAVTLLSVMFSTSLHLFVGPEPSLSSRYFMAPAKSPKLHRTMEEIGYPVADEGLLGKAIKETKGLKGKERKRYPLEMVTLPIHRHKISRFQGDAARYIIQVEAPQRADAPFRYRFLPTLLIRSLRAFFGQRFTTPALFLFFNVACVLASAMGLIHFMRQRLEIDRAWALVGALLTVTLVQVTATTPLTLLEPASMLAALGLFVLAERRDANAFAVVSAAAVAVKEVLVVAAILWVVATADLQSRELRHWLRVLLVAAVPIAAFAAIRVTMGGRALEVHFDSNLAQGEFPLRYLQGRTSSWSGAATAMLALLMSFGGLWLGCWGARLHPFLRRAVWTVPFVAMASLALSVHVGRVMGVVFPVIVPGFVLWIRHAIVEPTLHSPPKAGVL